MKRNQFKPSDIKYEPVQPLWMHSVQSYRTSKTTIGEIACIVLIVIAIAIVWAVMG